MKKLSTILLLLLVAVYGCEKEEDDTMPPSISIQSPSDGITLNLPDTVTIAATISDDMEISSISVELVDGDGVGYGAFVSVSPNGSLEQSFNLGMVIDDKSIPSGAYFLEFFASDGTNDAREFVEVFVNEVPTELLGQVMTIDEGAQYRVIYRNQEGGNVSTLGLYEERPTISTQPLLENVVVLDGAGAELSVFEAPGGQLLWSAMLPTSTSFFDPSVLHVDPKTERIFVGMSDGRVLSFSATGIPMITYDLPAGERALSLDSDDELLYILTEAPGGRRWSAYTMFSAIVQFEATVPILAEDMLVRSEYAYFGGDNEEFFLFDRIFGSHLAVETPSGVLGGMAVRENGDVFLGFGSAVQVIATNSNTSLLFEDVIPQINGVFFDSVNGALILGHAEGFDFYDPQTIESQSSIAAPGIMVAGMPFYNK